MYVFFSQADLVGCGYYRAVLPAKHLYHSRLAASTVGLLSSPLLHLDCEDVCMIQRQYHPEVFPLMERKKSKGIRIVGELDDDFWALTPDNSAFKVYYPGVVAQQEMEARARGELPSNARLLQPRVVLGDFLRTCDAVTTTTVRLATVLKKFNKNVYVLPNYFDDLELKSYPKPTKPITKFRILWAGSETHSLDLQPVVPALRKLITDFPHVKVIFIGYMPPGLEKIPASALEFYPATPHPDDYYRFLASVPSQIGIAPLLDNRFTSAKSWIKALEYGLAGYYPIVQDLLPYQPLKAYGAETCCGFLQENTADAWYTVLAHAVQNPQEVYDKACMWQELVLQHFRFSRNIHKWRDTYQEVLDSKPNSWFPKRVPVRAQ
jgi:glycosyltransferase involved in cell wall biosynthesis